MASSKPDTIEMKNNLLEAVRNGDLNQLKKIAFEMDEGLGIEKTISGVTDSRGYAVIHLAASRGHLDICNYLIGELHLDVNVKETERGRTPLQLAIEQSHLSTAVYLVEKGANPDIPDDIGATSLDEGRGGSRIEVQGEHIEKYTYSGGSNPILKKILQVN